MAKAKIKARAKIKSSSVKLNLTSLALEEIIPIKQKVNGKTQNNQYAIPVSLFRRRELFSKSTGRIKKGVAKEALGYVSQAYQSALTGIAYSQGRGSIEGRGVQESMVWPGPNGRSGASKVTMRTSGGTPLRGDTATTDVPDSAFKFKGYTSATLRRYHNFRDYLFKVAGLRQYRRPENRGQFKAAHKQGRRDRNKFALDARRASVARGKTASVIQTLLGPRSPAVSAAAQLTLGKLKSAKIGKNGSLPNRYRQRPSLTSFTPDVVPLGVLSGPVDGFDKAVSKFAQGEAMFVIPFLTGKAPQLSNNIVFPGTAGQEQTTAIVTKNELERPYIREFMAQMHKIMIAHVNANLRR
jgi:hypothetical protein